MTDSSRADTVLMTFSGRAIAVSFLRGVLILELPSFNGHASCCSERPPRTLFKGVLQRMSLISYFLPRNEM